MSVRRKVLAGVFLFLAGLIVAGNGQRARPVQDVGAVLAVAGIIMFAVGVRLWIGERRGR